MHTDYKIFDSLNAKWLKSTLDLIIDEIQSGFMKKRHISNNVQLVLDGTDYSYLCSDDSLIVFLGFYKALVEHNIIFQTIEKFGSSW